MRASRVLLSGLVVFILSLAVTSADPLWQQVYPTSFPSIRHGAAAGFDSNRGVVVLFGGFDETTHFNDTWEWDGTNWKLASPAHKPSPRRGHAIDFDSRRGVVVLFGGYNPTTGYSAETWEYNGVDWTQKTLAHSPPATWQHAMVYDSVRGVMVMFGSNNPFRNTTWEYDGTDWRQVTTAHAPSARAQVSLSFDPTTAKVLLFGGYDNTVLADTWTYNGTDWTQLSPAHHPIARRAHSAVYYPPAAGHVLFGGSDACNLPCAYYNDTWIFKTDGDWHQFSLSVLPSARHHFSLAYDSWRHTLVLSGGRLPYVTDTWVFTGSTNRPPVANAGDDVTAECTGPTGATVRLNGSLSSDPDGDVISYAWTAPGVVFEDPAVMRPYGVFASGATTATLKVTDPGDLNSSDTVLVTVRDTTPPAGSVTWPAAGACFGPNQIPVTITDNFHDSCSTSVTKTYSPGPGPSYTAHGNYAVTVTARDGSGNPVQATATFTIDLAAPEVHIATPAMTAGSPGALPFSLIFLATDDDGADGGIVHEQIYIDDCLAFDGLTYGNHDGLLSDETLNLDVPTLCQLATVCNRSSWVNPTITARATDCGGNIGSAQTRIGASTRLRPGMCSGATLKRWTASRN